MLLFAGLRVHRKDLRKLARRLKDYKLLVARKRDASIPPQGGEMLAVCEELCVSLRMKADDSGGKNV